MTIVLDLAPEKERTLKERARNKGVGVPEYIGSLIDREIHLSSIDELLKPVREEFAASGTNDEQLDSLIDEAREEIWRARH